MAKKSSMTTVGALKSTIGGLEKKIAEREDERTMLQKNRNIGLAAADDKDAASRIARLRQEKNYYNGVRERYQGLVDSKTKGRDTPLPSSDGILGTITNKLSEMFKK